ncbi:HpcH/HpaI aldolase/citrate lyase family protein [Streptomyces chartreusis]|uniref:HpcH/HpaI aldolase/citrate lyase family protein n=1 Tax=Streptomyces chartreusis TaxID=1969 RepID=UPI00199F7ABC|nr:CoA ester lyase [Streptomyces chartreusis]GGX58574.1 CoA ester lyase [Streptomyces chartreusis]
MNRSHDTPGSSHGAITRPCSTWLVTPASTPSRFDVATNSGADVALLDLEDSVPFDGKDAAREAVIGYLTQSGQDADTGATVLGVRLNAPGTVHGLKDLLAVAESGVRPDVVLVPKVESARDVEMVAQIVDADDGQRRVWALIETPRAVQRLGAILRARGLAGVLFGAADYAAAAGCRLSSAALWYPRAVLASGAAAEGLPAIDSPSFGLRDPDGLRRESKEAADLGFAGKVAIHPRQLPVIQAAFRPSAQELAAARAVVAADDAAHGGITTVDGQMVGPPLVAAARAVTARAVGIPAPAPIREVHSE